MNPKEYYARHAINHAARSISETSISKLSSSPSEVDWALHWLYPGGGAILDVGCATLALLTKASGLYDKRLGVDIVELPQWKQQPEVQTQLCDLNERPLPFEKESFDAVTCLMVMEHVFDPYFLANEIRRVLRADGRAVIAVPNIAGIKRRIELLSGKLPITSTARSFTADETGWDGYHLHNFTIGSFGWLLRRQGLKPLKWASQGKFQFIKRIRPSLFGNDLIVLVEKCEPNYNLQFIQ